MRFLVVLSLLLGACDLKPPPKKQAPAAAPVAPPTEPTPPTVLPDPATPRVPADAGPPISEACIDVAAHIAGILIADAKDPAQKAALEQDRTKIVRRSAEGCTRDAWSEAAMTCFKKAVTTAEMQVCSRGLRAP